MMMAPMCGGPGGGGGGVVVVVVMVAASLVAVLPSLCVARSDPLAALCDSVCWTEEALSDQCLEDRCSKFRVRSRAHRRCEDRCWDMVAPCQSLCREEAFRVLEACDRTCTAPDVSSTPTTATATVTTTATTTTTTTTTVPPGCHEDCFTHNMMLLKVSRLTPPNYQSIGQASDSTQ